MTLKLMILILCALALTTTLCAAQTQTTHRVQPQTPSEAMVFLQEQLNEAGQSGKVEGIEEKQKRRAAEYAALFKNGHWQDKELLSLADLYLTAEQYTNAEKVSLEYLKSPAPVETKRARTDLLSAYLGEKKHNDALTVAESLLDEKVYDFDLVFGERQGISQGEELAALKNLKAQLHLKYGLVVTSPPVEEHYGVAALPTIVLIDKKGMVRLIDTGYNEQRVGKMIEELINEAGE